MRRILRGPLGYRSRLVEIAGAGESPRYRLDTRVVLAVNQFIYSPAAGLALRVAATVRRFQSGHLASYLLYMLVALSPLPILR